MSTVRTDGELDDGGSVAGWVRRGGLLLLAVVVLAFIAATVISQVASLPDVDWRPRPGWLLLSTLLFLVGYGMHAELWRRLVVAAGADVPPLLGHRVFSASLLARYVPTQVLLALTRMRWLGRHGVPTTTTVLSIAYELALVVAASLLVSALYLLTVVEQPALRLAVAIVPALALVAVHPRVVEALFSRLARRFAVPPDHPTLPAGRLAAALAAYVVSFVVMGVGTYAMARGVADVGHLTVEVLAAYAVGYASAIAAFVVPGGLGARDAATAAALSTAMPLVVAVATAVCVRVLQTAIELGWSGVSELLGRRG